MRKESGCGELSCEQEAAPTQHCRGTANPCKNVNGALALPPTPALVTLPPIHGADNSLAAPCSLLSGGKKNEKKKITVVNANQPMQTEVLWEAKRLARRLGCRSSSAGRSHQLLRQPLPLAVLCLMPAPRIDKEAASFRQI